MEDRFEVCLRSGAGMVWMAAQEEERTVTRIQRIAERFDHAVFDWRATAGFVQLSTASVRQPGDGQCINIDQALHAVGQYNHERAVFVFRDLEALAQRMHPSPDFVMLARRLRDLSRQLRETGSLFVAITPSVSIPKELEDCFTLVEVSLPNQEERMEIIQTWISAHTPAVPCQLTEDDIHRLASAAAGMRSNQIQAALATAAVKRKALQEGTIEDMLAEKIAVVKTSEILEYVSDPATLNDIGGLGQIKDFVRKRAMAFGPAARRYGLPMPKGILILGPPGTGKSLVGKATAATLQMPLLRFDVGRVQASLVGQSEERMRRALAMAESQSPCVMWIDELEKAFAGVGGPSGDSGVTQRLFGQLLTWMQERRSPVFIIATANRIRQLPAEFLRKGRFDEIFFVDLPSLAERESILEVLLRKYGHDPAGLTTEALVRKLDRYTGAEMEYVIIEAMYEAFDDGQRPIAATDLEAATTRILPIADQMREEIEGLRRWGKTNARPAC